MSDMDCKDTDPGDGCIVVAGCQGFSCSWGYFKLSRDAWNRLSTCGRRNFRVWRMLDEMDEGRRHDLSRVGIVADF